MSSEAITIVTRWFEEVWNQGRVDTVEELMTPDCPNKVEGLDKPLNRDEFKVYHAAFLSAIPDLHVELDFITTEGNRTIVKWTITGTHKGPGLGIPPSHRPVCFSGLSMCEIERGQIINGFDSWNRGEMIASLMQVRMDELRQHVGLTQREAQVALMMAERLSFREIAEQLKIQPNTSRRHCERVLWKLGVKKRQDVAQALGKVPGSVLNRHGEDLKPSGS